MKKTQTIFAFYKIVFSVLVGSTFADQMVIAQGPQGPVFDAKINESTMNHL